MVKETSTIKETYTTKDEFNSLQIGGRNLILNSANLVGGKLKGTTANEYCAINVGKSYMNIEKPTLVTLSFDCEYVCATDDFKLLVYNTNNLGPILFEMRECPIPSNFKKGETIKFRASITSLLYKRSNPQEIDNYIEFYSVYDTGRYFGISNLKLELGNKPTDWTPAPEDLEQKVTTLTDKYNQTVQTVEGNKTTIANIKTSVDDVTGKVTSMDSRITKVEQTADGITTTVTANKDKWDKASSDASNAVSTAGTANSNASNALNKASDLEKRANNGEFNGRGVKSTTVEYQASTSGTTAPSGNWSSTVPTVANGSYLWTRTTITYTSGDPSVGYSVARMGATGAKGDKGLDGKSPTVSVSKSGATTTITVVNADGSKTTQTVNDGTNGTPGKDGATGKTSYFHVKYSNDGGKTFTANNGETVGDYLGTYTDFVEADSNSVSVYTWVKIKGNTGATGAKGETGSDGKGISSIVHHYLVTNVTTGITSSTSGWKDSPQSVTASNKYLWYYQTINYTVGNATNTTPAIIGVYGDTGNKGATGKGISSVTPQYYLSTSNTTQTGGSWKTTQDAWSSGKYYWTRDSIAWSDGTTTYTTPTLATGLNNANSTANNAQTIANQTASKFQWIVKSGSSATDFTLTDRTAQLVADSINLKGLVKFKGLDTSTQDLINSKANQSIVDNWAKDATVAGETTINGGYIKTNTINTDQLAVKDIFATGSAVMKLINAEEINANRITSGLMSANHLDAHGLSVINTNTGQQTFSITDDGEVTIKGTAQSANYVDGKTGWSINNDGTAEFNDIIARGSVITNDGGIVSSGGSGKNLVQRSFFTVPQNNGTNGYQNKFYGHDAILTENVAKIFKPNTTYTVSYKYRQDEVTPDINVGNPTLIGAMTIWSYAHSTTRYIFNNNNGFEMKAGESTSFKYTFTTPALSATEDKWTICFYGRLGSKSDGSTVKDLCTFYDIKIEEGDVATAWSPAPEDQIPQVRFWAGESYEKRNEAPFIVYNDGSLKATKGNYSGLWTGDIKVGNISISDAHKDAGDDALLMIQNGESGVKRVQLTDKNSSSFAQDVIITNNTYTPMISLKQDGSATYKKSITVADKTILDEDGITLNKENLLTTTPDGSGFLFTRNVDIGTANQSAKLNVHGDISTDNITVNNTLYFGNVLQITKNANGINIDFI